LGEISKIRIGHDGSGLGDSWFLDKAIVTVDTKQYFFLFGEWLGGSEAKEGRKEVEIVASNADGVACKPMVQYKVTVVTGDRTGAATNAAVTIQIFGEGGDTGPRVLEAPKKPFQRNEVTCYHKIVTINYFFSKMFLQLKLLILERSRKSILVTMVATLGSWKK
jgi:hypothetical protein